MSGPPNTRGFSAPFIGQYYVYHWNVARVQGDFWDFPMLGQDRNSVIISGNIFSGGGLEHGADVFSVPKSILYNNQQPRSIQFYRGLATSLEPPNVLDQNSSTYLVSAPSAAGDNNSLWMYRLTNTNTLTPTLNGPYYIRLPLAYRYARSARQPYTNYTIDTLDARFQNSSTQVGNSLWQTHCIDFHGYPACRFYEINLAARTVNQYGTYYYTPTSDDFNPSIATDDNNNVYVTWNMCDRQRSLIPSIFWALP